MLATQVPEDYQPDNGLKLTACVLADIFNGEITTWDDSAIVDIQDGDFDPPSGEKIVVYHRTYGSSTTKGITQYLHAACPDKWPADKVGSCVEINFGRRTPSTRRASVAASARWRGVSTPSTRRRPRDGVGSMAWRLTG